MTTPNLYEFATKELAQDATIAYILAWADPKYRKSHPRLHALGTELLRSLLLTQGVGLPLIQTLHKSFIRHKQASISNSNGIKQENHTLKLTQA